jgi:hypothetical protein
MIYGRINFGTYFDKNSQIVYIFGGISEKNTVLNSIEKFSFLSENWSLINF